ncbi:MAG: NTP transferase domain-containing protein [Deltaproteobacteria bacterium]|nr:NTP transferase domain-containing protein [Deltaproteobacteria bacterium]
MKEAATHLSGIILAGGKSSRFGKDKSRLELAGRRVPEKLLEVLGQFPFQRLAVVTARGKAESWPEMNYPAASCGVSKNIDENLSQRRHPPSIRPFLRYALCALLRMVGFP